MIICRAPFRVSFTGGGSDLAAYYQRSQGAVISTSINRHIYLTLHPFFDEEKIHLKYSKSELVSEVDHINHPIFRNVLKESRVSGVEISSVADIPSGTGLGSSSSFTVALLHCLSAHLDQKITKEELAEKACNIEIDLLGEPIGKQDQYAAAFGGLNLIRFDYTGRVDVEPIQLSKEHSKNLEDRLMMFYLGFTRSAKTVLKEQKKNITFSNKIFESLQRMVEMTFELKDTLENGNLDAIGEILHRSWILKKSMASKVSNKIIDHYYNLAINDGGALGGKLLGAGSGGFLLFYVPKENQDKLRKVLVDLREIDFTFSFRGSEIIFNEEK